MKETIYDDPNGGRLVLTDRENTALKDAVYTFPDGKAISSEWNHQFYIDTVKPLNGEKTPLIIAEFHSGGVYMVHDFHGIFYARAGEIRCDEMLCAYAWNHRIPDETLNVISVTEDSVTVVIGGEYIENREPQTVVIRRGEKKRFEHKTKESTRIDGDDYDYEYTTRLIITCL